MYVGNNDGVLEFDGVSWRKISLNIHSGVRGLGIDSRGTIFVGARGTFGYLAPGPDGASQFVSLLERVPKTDRNFNDVWDVLPTSEGVYFASRRRLFLYTSSSTLKVFAPTDYFGRAFVFHDELFISSTDHGLLTMKGGELVPSRSGIEGIHLNGSLVFANGPRPVLAANKRLYHFSLSSIVPFPTAADKYFSDLSIQAIHELSNGDVIVSTGRGGVVWLNQNGVVQRIIQKTDGLPSDFTSAIFSDRDGEVWLASDSGVARFATSLSSFGERQGLHGNVYVMKRLGGTIYAGTALGLFRMHTIRGAEPVFTPVPEIQEQVFAFAEANGAFFVGAKRGLYLMSGKTVRLVVPDAVVYNIGVSRDPDIFYTAGGGGIQMLKRDGSDWNVVNTEHGTGQDFRTVVEGPDGRVWGTTENSVWEIDFRSQPPKAEQFSKSKGVPGGFNNAYLFRDHVVVASARGLLQFSETKQTFEPDPELGSQFSDGSQGVSLVKKDEANQQVWITGAGFHGFLRGNKWVGAPMMETGIDEIYDMHIDPDRTVWFSGVTGSLLRYEKPTESSHSHFETLIRSVILTDQGKAIFRGDGPPPVLRLPYKDNALRFECAAPFVEKQSAVQYQYWLQGSDKTWAPWTSEARKDYTNLSEGSYTFRVRARNPHGIESPEAVFQFSLQAPWYRTWWAYAIYATAFLLAGWLILRWRLAALEARNKWLENVVEERTAEVRSERDQNEALLLNILPKPIASELRTTGVVKPTSFEDVTVCFSDFVGFTLSSEKLPPQELISSLNEYFTAFDEIIGRYGLEKLKTIGDAYMFAGGLPNASLSHAVDAVLAALEMVEVVRKLARPEKGVNWSIRLGLYSGPVVAGVVGVRKFAFDIWGNTVNFAARMESAGSANRVNLSETTETRVMEFIDCEPRGPVRIKEGREMEMYFALRLKPELLAGPMIDGIPEAFRHKYEKAFSKPPKSFPNLNGHHAS